MQLLQINSLITLHDIIETAIKLNVVVLYNSYSNCHCKASTYEKLLFA